MATLKLIGDPAYVAKGTYTLRFVCRILDGSTYTENGYKFNVVNAKFVPNPDDEANKVLSLDADSDGKKTGTAYITIPGGIPGDFSKGFSISIDVKPTKQSNDSNGIFGFGFLEDDLIKEAGIVADGCVYVQASTAFKIEKDDPNGSKILLYPHENNDGDSVWVAGNTVNNDKDYLCNAGKNKWNNLTYVFTDTSVSVYVNGVLAARKTVDNSGFLKYLNYKDSAMLNLGCQINTTSNKFTGYMDNVKLFNGALSDEEVMNIANNRNK